MLSKLDEKVRENYDFFEPEFIKVGGKISNQYV